MGEQFSVRPKASLGALMSFVGGLRRNKFFITKHFSVIKKPWSESGDGFRSRLDPDPE
jgi:hypothetical protein